MNRAPLRLAVAGVGSIGRTHAGIIRKHPDLNLVALVDPDPETRTLASEWGATHYETLDRLLEQDPPDGIVLATPNALHVAQTLHCVDAGVAVLLEKPVATTVEEGRQLMAVVESHQARVLVGHHRAHSSIMAQAVEVVQSGRLGRLVTVQGSALFFKPDHYFQEGPWRRQAGGGPILINLIHEVHNLRMLCGEVKAVQALASHSTRGFDVEDTVAITLMFESGVLGSFVLSDTAASPRSWEQTSQENPAYPTHPDQDCYFLAGTQGSLAVPTMRMHWYDEPEGRSWWEEFSQETLPLQREDPLQKQMDHFAAVIRGATAPRVSVRDGLLNLQITAAIHQATQTHQTVFLSSLATR